VSKGLHPGIRVFLALAGFYLFVKYVVPVFSAPLPFSLIFMYMALAVIGAAVYLSLFYDIGETVVSPLFSFLGGGVSGGLATGARYLVLVALPVAVWFHFYQKLGAATEAPLGQRTIHPAPPGEFSGLSNPFRKEEREEMHEAIEEGRAIYYKNCVFCHGDHLDGKGIFYAGLNPQPANFQDPGTIAMLQESFLFWRISTGGIGLPKESTPWDSAMPRWETMLSEEERWKVILFLYDHTGYSPRTWE